MEKHIVEVVGNIAAVSEEIDQLATKHPEEDMPKNLVTKKTQNEWQKGYAKRRKPLLDLLKKRERLVKSRDNRKEQRDKLKRAIQAIDDEVKQTAKKDLESIMTAVEEQSTTSPAAPAELPAGPSTTAP